MANRARDLSTAEGGRRRYRVLAEGLQYPTDPAIIRRLFAGENIPHDARGPMREPAVGAIIDDMPDGSIASALAQGWIEPYGAGPPAAPVFVDAETDDEEAG